MELCKYVYKYILVKVCVFINANIKPIKISHKHCALYSENPKQLNIHIKKLEKELSLIP